MKKYFLFFNDEFDWRKKSGWKENFLQSNRKYVSVALGFELRVLVDYKEIKKLDATEEGYKNVAAKIKSITTAFENLI